MQMAHQDDLGEPTDESKIGKADVVNQIAILFQWTGKAQEKEKLDYRLYQLASTDSNQLPKETKKNCTNRTFNE